MDIIKISKPIVTRMGTVVTRYVENGRLYKSIDFEKSANKYAKQNGLVKTVVRYGDRNKPETVYDTFERQIKKVETEHTKSFVTQPKRGRKKGSKNKPKPETNRVEKKSSEIIKPETSAQVENQKLIPISTDSFKTENAKKLYNKIHKYIKLAGKNGSFKDAKIMSEEGHDFGSSSVYSQLKKSADIVLSVNRIDGDLHLTLGRNNLDKSRNFTLFDILFDKDGQMKEGTFPVEHINFKRYGANVRRLKKGQTQFLPVAEDDRVWSSTSISSLISPSNNSNLWYAEEDNAVGGAFELFLEFARLHTSVFK